MTARNLAAEVGTSTTAVYTNFDGMGPLRDAVRSAGFARLRDRLASLPLTSDPVADVSLCGLAYLAIGIANPDIYRTMFLEVSIDPGNTMAQEACITPVAAAVDRCIDMGRFQNAPSELLTGQLWIATHGVVTLAIANMFAHDRMLDYMTGMSTHLYVGFGDDREASIRSIHQAKRRLADIDMSGALL
ncbi:TetR-like C-terminal domain-containing protein [Nocardia vinacea]|uniref:TetR/AcrR family transcriptional regulator n=1 Tax=Nocardia vinacea TaxID=96468 RepID=UPI0033DE77B0